MIALNAVISDIKRRGGTDHTFSLGDVAATGPQPSEVIDFLRDSGWGCVMGNTDEDLIKSVPEILGTDATDEERIARAGMDNWTIKQLSISNRETLLSFGSILDFQPKDGPKFLFYHGSPRSNVEGLFPTATDDTLREILKGYDGDVYAGGHTHSQMLRRLDGALIINPGSVGLPFELTSSEEMRHPSHAEYAIVEWMDKAISVELISVPYGLSDLQRIVTSRVPDPQWWLSEWYDSRL